MADTLRPCPFCGSTNIDPEEWAAHDGTKGPGCSDCGAIAGSVEQWNARALVPVTPTLGLTVED